MRILAVVPLMVALAGPAPAAAAPRADLASALEVLHSWDARRADAWAATDVVALRSLYVRGSGAGRADVRLLRAYEARGFVVRRLVTQVFAVGVLHRDRATMRLRVFDRVAGGEVVRDGHAGPLASTPPATRTVELRRVTGDWRVEAVSGSGSAPRAARR
jgi:hypothetical protein